jgi:hypothetical protein
MSIKTEGRHAGCFLYSEANKTRSRAVALIAHGQVLKAGAVLAYNATEKLYHGYDNASSAGRGVASGILYDNVDASLGAVEAVIIVRDAEVNGEELIFADTESTADRSAAIADLKTAGIIVRWSHHVT